MKKSLVVILVILATIISLNAELVRIGNANNNVEVIQSNSTQTILEMTVGHFNKEEVVIDGQTFNTLELSKEGLTQIAGAPAVPTMTRSVMIDSYSKPELRVIDSEYTEISLTVAPSKGVIKRNIDPETVAYSFGEEYNNDDFFPASSTSLGSAYIMRSVRGVAVRFSPFQYNHNTGTLRIYTSIKVAVANSSVTGENVLTRNVNNVDSFNFINQNHFINYETSRYDALDEIGSMLVIAPANYFATMQAYVDWKNQKGISTVMVDIATIGNNTTSIKNYIQTYYDEHPNFAFVQIAGDSGQITTPTVAGGGSDPSYSLVDGNDTYPDIFIGRFSAENTTQLATQVERTIAYERDMNSSTDYLTNALGIASSQGGGSQGDMGESDIAHMNLIRQDLLGYNYDLVDQIYDPSASASGVAASVNAGKGFINYVGHGSENSWVSSGFSSSNVNNLTNVDKLPFIVSVACVNGDFVSASCFAEAWLRATDNGDPTGAIAMYAATINQSWDSPMRGQDEITDLVVAEELSSIGGLYYSGSCEMMDEYGADGIEMFKTWHIFGDASLQVRTNTPEEMTVNHTGILFVGSSDYTVNTGVANALVAVSYNNELLGSAYADASGSVALNLENLPVNPVDLTLTVTALNKVTYQGVIAITPAAGPYVIIQSAPSNVNYNQDGNFSFEIKNVGVETASDLTITLAGQAGVTVNDGTETVAAITADQNIVLPADAFSIVFDGDFVNGDMIVLPVTISNSSNTWEYSVSIPVLAPVFALGDIVAEEVNGNGNNRMDAGETFSLSTVVSNVGGLDAIETAVSLVYPAASVTTAASTITLTEVSLTATQEVTFEITLSSQIAPGTELEFSVNVASEYFTAESDFSEFVGLSLEDFESQSLTSFGWTTTGGTYTFSDEAHDGDYSLKSADITSSGTTTLSVDFESNQDSEINFWMNVSSEQSYDFVKFFIDGVQKVSLSGNLGWDEYTYDVVAGPHTFKWQYTKDSMVDSYDDCFYLDTVVFPAAGGVAPGNPEIAIDIIDYNFGTVDYSNEASQDLVIANSGDANSIGSITVESPFYVRNSADELVGTLGFTVAAAGSTTLELVFAPTEGESFTATATVTTDDTDNASFTLNLEGVANTTPNAGDDIIPAITSLEGNYPNPFNPETTIRYGLKDNGAVIINIYNLLGQKVKTLINENQKAGYHTAVWNGKDDNQRNVASGVYFYKMISNSYSKTSKMILMK